MGNNRMSKAMITLDIFLPNLMAPEKCVNRRLFRNGDKKRRRVYQMELSSIFLIPFSSSRMVTSNS
jgi:hypothetical protein